MTYIYVDSLTSFKNWSHEYIDNPCLSASTLCTFETSPKLTISVPKKKLGFFHSLDFSSHSQNTRRTYSSNM